jgi:hypothetical protein
MAETRKIPAPIANPETAAFWQAAEAGKLLLKRCRACGKPHWYPRAHCPFCFSAETEWREGQGTGTIYSYSIMRRAAVPYAVAYVTLDEGVTMLTNIVNCDFDRLRIGQNVRVVFHPSDGGPPVPMFAPV